MLNKYLVFFHNQAVGKNDSVECVPIFTKIVKLVNFPTGLYSVHQNVTMKGMENSRMKPMPLNMQQITIYIQISFFSVILLC